MWLMLQKRNLGCPSANHLMSYFLTDWREADYFMFIFSQFESNIPHEFLMRFGGVLLINDLLMLSDRSIKCDNCIYWYMSSGNYLTAHLNIHFFHYLLDMQYFRRECVSLCEFWNICIYDETILLIACRQHVNTSHLHNTFLIICSPDENPNLYAAQHLFIKQPPWFAALCFE